MLRFMKLLLIHEGSYYLVDLDTLKPKTLREVVLEAGDDKLKLAQSSQLDETDLDDLLAKALNVKAPAPSPAPKKASAGKTGLDPKAVRDWAKKEGITVNAQGRVPKDIQDQYLEYLAAQKRA